MVTTARGWVWGAAGVVGVLAGALGIALVASGWNDLTQDRASTESAVRPQPADAPPTAPRVEWFAAPGAAASSPTVSAPAAPATPAVVLSGVAMGVGGGNVAIVSINQRPDMLVRVGDAMTATTTVVRIDDSSMTYRLAGAEWRVFVKSQQPASQPIKLDAPPKPLPGFVAGAPPIARPAGTEPGSGNDAFRQVVEKKMQAIAAGR